jgi:hypothetical protein
MLRISQISSRQQTQRLEYSILARYLLCLETLDENGPSSPALPSRVMLDNWISFAVSPTPNDVNSTNGVFWHAYSEPGFRTPSGNMMQGNRLWRGALAFAEILKGHFIGRYHQRE